jgi:flavodoxin
MKKTLVAYFSQTGNTQAVAEAIFGALQGEKDIKPIDEALSFEDYGLVFVGFPVQSHSVPYKAETFLRRVPAGKALALFCTHGSLPGHRLSREALEYALVCAAKAKLLGTFACRGKLSMKALDFLAKSPEHQEWADMAASAATHPDDKDLHEAREFARKIWTIHFHGAY